MFEFLDMEHICIGPIIDSAQDLVRYVENADSVIVFFSHTDIIRDDHMF